MEKKRTKKEILIEMKGVLVDMNVDNINEYVTFIDHEIELLEKKNSKSGMTATQKANEGLKEIVLEVLGNIGVPSTIDEVRAFDERLSVLSNQKVSALMTQLKNAQIVVNVKNGKKSVFSLANATDTEVAE